MLNIVLFLWQVLFFPTRAGGQGSAANLAWMRSRVAAHTPPNAPSDDTEEEARAFSNERKSPPRQEGPGQGRLLADHRRHHAPGNPCHLIGGGWGQCIQSHFSMRTCLAPMSHNFESHTIRIPDGVAGPRLSSTVWWRGTESSPLRTAASRRSISSCSTRTATSSICPATSPPPRRAVCCVAWFCYDQMDAHTSKYFRSYIFRNLCSQPS